MNLPDGEFLLSLEVSNNWSREQTKRLWKILNYPADTGAVRRKKLRTKERRQKFLDRAMKKIADKVSARLDPAPEPEQKKRDLRDLFYTQAISKQTLMEMYTSIDKA